MLVNSLVQSYFIYEDKHIIISSDKELYTCLLTIDFSEVSVLL